MGYQPLILVVEDNEVNRELLREILEDENYRVIEAENGKEGVELAKKKIPDLVLMDVEMPVMNGLEATKAIIEHPETSRIPVIVLTGLNDMEDRIKAFEFGAMDYVNKPFDMHELLAHVRSYLRFSLLNKKYVLSTLSPETGLPNRAAFREKLPEKNSPVLLLIKIDNIEAVSRFYGDAIGAIIEKDFTDFLICQKSIEINEKVELFHLGKGLFGFLVDNSDGHLDKDRAKTCVSDLISVFTSHGKCFKDTHYEIELTAVIGFDRENILEKSEMALEEAIRNKTGIVIMDDIIKDVYQNIGENIFWLKKIKEAIQYNRIIPYFQAIFDSRLGKIGKYESLLRMIDETGNVVPPGQFLLIAKNSKYYPDITKIMASASIEIFKNRKEEFSLNLSAIDIENKNVRDFLIDLLVRNPEAASRMTLEIVEQEGIRFLDILKQFIQSVKKYGTKIAIDDFGSGYSNFRALLDIEIDYIKIDGSLIRSVHTDKESQRVIETIKSFADKVNIGVIAEFVENEEIFNCLKEMGIHLFQGYYIGKPQKL